MRAKRIPKQGVIYTKEEMEEFYNSEDEEIRRDEHHGY